MSRIKFDITTVKQRDAANDFSRFSANDSADPSDSPFMKNLIFEKISRQNPSLPPVPADAVFVIAGQQPGLLSGPLYTFLKAVTVITLAKRLSSETGRTVLPLFWVASEDHDILEVNRVTVNGRRFVHEMKTELKRGRMPQVGDVSLGDAKENLLEFLREALPETEFTEWIMNVVAACNYSNYANAFSDLIREFFGGYDLRTVDPIGIRTLTAPVLACLLRRWPDVRDAFEAGTEALVDAGLKPPLEAPGFYEISGGMRVPVETTVKTVRLSNGEMSFAAAADEIDNRPGDFSPNAALRPVLQNAVIPALATGAGPTEALYLRQIREIHNVVNVTPSATVPRISATFVEDKIFRVAQKAGLGIERILESGQMLADYTADDVDDPVIVSLEEKAKNLISAVDTAAGADPSRTVERNRKAVETALEKLLGRLKEEVLEAAGVGRGRLKKVVDAVLPGGRPQERAVNVIEFLNRYGPDFISRAIERLDPLEAGHQIVKITVE